MIVVVILSGGQDSTTCLYWAKKKWPDKPIHAITFRYGQKHVREIECAKRIAAHANIARHDFIELPTLLGTSPLVNADTKLGQYEKPDQLPGGIEPTFIPCRNILFLTMAMNYAMAFDKREGGYPEVDLVTGVCEADFGGYPDCRQEFINSMAYALHLGVYGTTGTGRPAGGLVIHTPLMTLTKKQTVLLAGTLGCIDAMADTHTCYQGTAIPCRKCHACIIRERGFVEAGIADPLVIRHKGDWPPSWSMREVRDAQANP